MSTRKQILDRLRSYAGDLRESAYTVVRGHIDWQAWNTQMAPAAIAIAVTNGRIIDQVVQHEDQPAQSMRVAIDMGVVSALTAGHQVDDTTLDRLYDDAVALLRDLASSGLIRGLRRGTDELAEWHQPAGTPGASALHGILLTVDIEY